LETGITRHTSIVTQASQPASRAVARPGEPTTSSGITRLRPTGPGEITKAAKPTITAAAFAAAVTHSKLLCQPNAGLFPALGFNSVPTFAPVHLDLLAAL
jgi:hypothetical protein